MAVSQLQDRFSTDDSKTGLRAYLQLEEKLLTGSVLDTCKQYPERSLHENDINSSLSTKLQMFRHHYKYSTLYDAQQCMKAMCPEVRVLFPLVEKLIRLLLISPATSCSAERSSPKTWLCSTVSAAAECYCSVSHASERDG